MAAERYPGERKGLSLFLEELMRALRSRGGERTLLGHAIRRGLETGELEHLRHARQIFNRLPRPERQALSAALLGPTAEREPPGRAPADAAAADAAEAPTLTIRFEAPREPAHGEPPVRIALRHEDEAPDSPLCVTIEAGTLPSVAADALRRIATLIETDRRLLSGRYWQEEAAAGGGGPGPGRRDVR